MKTIVILVVMLLPVTAFGKKKDIPLAPLPAAITNAKNVFLVNGGGSGTAFDAFYAEMKQWGKYNIVGSPDEADLIIELKYWVDHNGTDVSSFYNTYTKQTQVVSSELVDPQLEVTVYEAKSKTALWSSIDHRRLARREKNREKEMVNSAVRLVDELKARSQ